LLAVAERADDSGAFSFKVCRSRSQPCRELRFKNFTIVPDSQRDARRFLKFWDVPVLMPA